MIWLLGSSQNLCEQVIGDCFFACLYYLFLKSGLLKDPVYFGKNDFDIFS